MLLLDPQLVAFEAIIKAGTVHGAAETLFLTQTAVTQRLRMLEQKMKATLFLRSRRGMLLTTEGEALHRYCQRVVELEGGVLAEIQGGGISSTTRIKITGPSSIMRSRIVSQCESVLKNYPFLFISFQIDDCPELSQKLKLGETDLIIVSPEQITAEMDRKPLVAEQYLLVCSSNWRDRPLRDILAKEKIIDFNPCDQMSFSYLKHFNLLDTAQTERHFINNTESIAQLFSTGVGYGVLTTEFAKPYIDTGQLIVLNNSLHFENTLSLAWYPRSEPPAYFAALIRAIC